MSDTKIQWTDVTWNPVVGCSRVSEGCRNCYAERMDRRIRGAAKEEFREWSARNASYNVRLHEERLAAPLRWRKPRRVFVNSMSDLFHEEVPDAFIDRVFAVMALTPQHTYQVLTKRPERMRAYVAEHCPALARRTGGLNIPLSLVMQASDETNVRVAASWPLPNVWLGTSVEDQRAADERIPELLATPAAVRFLSCEPLLGPIAVTSLDCWRSADGMDGESWDQEPVLPGHMDGLDWVIVGGESGPNARPCDLAWVRSLRDQCQAASVAVFIKQLGSKPMGIRCAGCGEWDPANLTDDGGHSLYTDHCGPVGLPRLRHGHGGEMAEWPEDLRVREWPR